MQHLQQIRRIVQDRLDAEEIVRLVEVVETGQSLRRAFEGTLIGAFALLTLHSAHILELPSVAIYTVSYSIPVAVLGLFGEYISAVRRRRRSSNRSQE